MAEGTQHSTGDKFIGEEAIKYFNSAKEESIKEQHDVGRWSLLKPGSNGQSTSHLSRPLPYLGCGIGWLLFVLGFVFPIVWYIAAALFLAKYQLKDPREREGLAAASIAAVVFSIVVFILLFVFFI